MKTIKVKIYGIVQGVYFRDFIEFSALQLDVKGWIKNCEDGTVEAEFQGSNLNLYKMLELCKKGPMTSKVDKIETIEADQEPFPDFKII